MTVTAELDFVSNVASEAAAAASSVDRLYSSLTTLASIGSISFGGDLSAELATAAAHAAAVAETQASSAAKIEEIGREPRRSW